MGQGFCTKIINQTRQYESDDKSLAIQNVIRSSRMERNEGQLQNIRPNLSEQQILLINLNQENGGSTWLTTLPLKNEEVCFYQATILGFNWFALWLAAVQSP